MRLGELRVETVIVHNSHVTQKCETAKELENRGDYEGARAALNGLWTVVGERPSLDGLEPATQGELLLRVGALSGWIGSSQQIGGAQEFSKDLIGESIRVFESLGDSEKMAEAQTDLAICYWRAGAMDEARVWFNEAMSRAATPENKLRILVNEAIVEIFSDRLNESLRILEKAAPLLEEVEDHASKGRYHMQRALVFKRIGGHENLDSALIENAAASFHLEEAGHTRYLARVENNIGFILMQLNRNGEALEHLDKARQIFIRLKDSGSVAQVNETRARAFLAQSRYGDAEHAAFSAVSTLEQGEEHSLLAEALRTHGISLARTGRQPAAFETLMRAATVAELAGDLTSSGRTRMVVLEELQHTLSPMQVFNLYLEADARIGFSPDAETSNLARSAARIAIAAARRASSPDLDRLLVGGSLKEEMRRYESELIRRAFDQAGGQLTRAARLLGITHQGLGEILKTRHKSLRKVPAKARRRSIIKRDN